MRLDQETAFSQTVNPLEHDAPKSDSPHPRLIQVWRWLIKAPLLYFLLAALPTTALLALLWGEFRLLASIVLIALIWLGSTYLQARLFHALIHAQQQQHRELGLQLGLIRAGETPERPNQGARSIDELAWYRIKDNYALDECRDVFVLVSAVVGYLSLFGLLGLSSDYTFSSLFVIVGFLSWFFFWLDHSYQLALTQQSKWFVPVALLIIVLVPNFLNVVDTLPEWFVFDAQPWNDPITVIMLLFLAATLWWQHSRQQIMLFDYALRLQSIVLEDHGILVRNPKYISLFEENREPVLFFDLALLDSARFEAKRAISATGTLELGPSELGLLSDKERSEKESLLRSAYLSFHLPKLSADNPYAAYQSELAAAIQSSLADFGIQASQIEDRYKLISVVPSSVDAQSFQLIVRDTENDGRSMLIEWGEYEHVLNHVKKQLNASQTLYLNDLERKRLGDRAKAAVPEGFLVLAFSYQLLPKGSFRAPKLLETNFVGLLCLRPYVDAEMRAAIRRMQVNKLHLVGFGHGPQSLALAIASSAGLLSSDLKSLSSSYFEKNNIDTSYSTHRLSVEIFKTGMIYGLNGARKQIIFQSLAAVSKNILFIPNDLDELGLIQAANYLIVSAKSDQSKRIAYADAVINDRRILPALPHLINAYDRVVINSLRRTRFWLLGSAALAVVLLLFTLSWLRENSFPIFFVSLAVLLLLLSLLHWLLGWALLHEHDEEPASHALHTKPEDTFWIGLGIIDVFGSLMCIGYMMVAISAQMQAIPEPKVHLSLLWATLVCFQIFLALNARRWYGRWRTTIGQNPRLINVILIAIGVALALIYLPPLNMLLGLHPLSLDQLSFIIVGTSAVLWQGELWRWIWRLIQRIVRRLPVWPPFGF